MSFSSLVKTLWALKNTDLTVHQVYYASAFLNRLRNNSKGNRPEELISLVVALGQDLLIVAHSEILRTGMISFLL
jgi:hypothetical protein